MMDSHRHSLAVRLTVALLVGSLTLVYGCGGSSEGGQQVKVSPELEAKTQNMLKNMAGEMKKKHQSDPSLKKRGRPRR